MIDSKLTNGGMGSGETHLSMYQNKQSPIALKKVALRDVNDNRNVMYNYPEGSCSLGGKLVNGSKLSGTKRSNPPTCSPGSVTHQSFKGVGVNEHIFYASGEVDTKPGKKRALGCGTSCAPAFSSLLAASPMTFSPVRTSLPIFTEKLGNFLTVSGSNLLSIPPSSEVLHSVASNGITDERRTERLFNLQKLLKHCDESDQKGYIECKLF